MRNLLPHRKMPPCKGKSLSKIAENGSLWSWDDSVGSWLASPLCRVFLGQDQVRSCPEWKRWVCCAWPGCLEGEEASGSAGKLSVPGRCESGGAPFIQYIYSTSMCGPTMRHALSRHWKVNDEFKLQWKFKNSMAVSPLHDLCSQSNTKKHFLNEHSD